VNSTNTKSDDEEFDKFDSSPAESPTKSVSTGATTMVNVSPTRANLSPLSASTNKDLFIITEKVSASNGAIQQQSLAYPKMEMNMSSLMIPSSPLDNKTNTQSIYVKEPALR